METKQVPDVYWHIVRNGQLIRAMFATKRRAMKAAAKIEGATVVPATGRAELRQAGIVVDRQVQP